jgi:hypothetical protein
MGITAMIPDMTIGQLKNEADARWGEIWDSNAARMTLMLMCPRKERKLMELHGDMIEHGQPVIASFHRPRAGASLLEDQGFDPRSASFQFVDIASPDLGPWMQQLVTAEGWLRSSIEIMALPHSIDNPAQRGFETERMLCFRHPSLAALERYYLPFPAQDIPGKCFVSLPRRQAAELARQQAEVLGVGRLERKLTVSQATPEEMPVAPVETEPESMDAMMDAFSTDLIAGIASESEPESTPVPLPNHPSVEEQLSTDQTPDEELVFVPLPAGSAPTSSAPMAQPEPLEEQATQRSETVNVPVPKVEEEVGEPMSDIEIEFRDLVNGLLAAGVDPSEMMDDPRWENINERATAVGFETWPVFLQLATME